jgi:hypothetical protein
VLRLRWTVEFAESSEHFADAVEVCLFAHSDERDMTLSSSPSEQARCDVAKRRQSQNLFLRDEFLLRGIREIKYLR